MINLAFSVQKNNFFTLDEKDNLEKSIHIFVIETLNSQLVPIYGNKEGYYIHYDDKLDVYFLYSKKVSVAEGYVYNTLKRNRNIEYVFKQFVSYECFSFLKNTDFLEMVYKKNNCMLIPETNVIDMQNHYKKSNIILSDHLETQTSTWLQLKSIFFNNRVHFLTVKRFEDEKLNSNPKKIRTLIEIGTQFSCVNIILFFLNNCLISKDEKLFLWAKLIEHERYDVFEHLFSDNDSNSPTSESWPDILKFINNEQFKNFLYDSIFTPIDKDPKTLFD